MKRCPQCNRVERDDTLVYCRTDGTALIRDSASASSEIETSILPHVTDASTNHPTAPTSVLPTPQVSGRTHELKPKPRRLLSTIGVALVIPMAVIAVAGYFYFSRDDNPAIESIAVLPFQNVSNDSNLEYLSEGIAESLINSLTQLQ